MIFKYIFGLNQCIIHIRTGCFIRTLLLYFIYIYFNPYGFNIHVKVYHITDPQLQILCNAFHCSDPNLVQGLSSLSIFSSLFQAAGSSTLFAVMNEHAQGDCGNCIPGGGEALKWSAAGAHLFRRVTG